MKITLFCKTCFLACLLVSTTAFSAESDQQNEILLLGKANLPNVQNGDRFIYKLNGVFLALSVGDVIDGCTVLKKGQIDCGNSAVISQIPQSLEQKNSEIITYKTDIAKKNSQLRDLSNDIKTQNKRMRELESYINSQSQLIAKLREVAQQQTISISDYRHQLKRQTRDN